MEGRVRQSNSSRPSNRKAPSHRSVEYSHTQHEPKRRTMTEGYLNQRVPCGNTVAMNQNYVNEVLNNPKTPRENREVVIVYVLNHPEKFTPLADRTDGPVQNKWASKRNGAADFDFIKSFRRKYL